MQRCQCKKWSVAFLYSSGCLWPRWRCCRPACKKKRRVMLAIFVELGTRQHYSDNLTMFSGHKIYGYSIMSQFVMTWLLHLDNETFFIFFRVTKGLLRYRVFVVAKLKSCHVSALQVLCSVHTVWKVGCWAAFYLRPGFDLSKYCGCFLFRTIRVNIVRNITNDAKNRGNRWSICNLWNSVPQVKMDGPWKLLKYM